MGWWDHWSIFLQKYADQNVTVNGTRYRNMITDYLLPKTEAHNLDDIKFPQYDATRHTARQTMALLRERFGKPLISRFGTVNWPPRSCDFASLDYFLSSYIKYKINMTYPATIEELEVNITHVIEQMLQRVMEYWKIRMDHASRSYGQHLKEIIF